MSNNVKVSVIMPFLNSIEYLKECMDSVVNQKLKEIEILCVDAGSTDGTLEVLNEYAEKDSRIVIINSDKKSYGYQINLGLARATGEYFGIVESDDYIKEEMYDELYKLAVQYDCDVVKSDFCRFVHENNERVFAYAPLTNMLDLYNKVICPIENLKIFKAYVLNQPGIYRMKMIHENNIKLNETPGASYQDNGLWFQVFSLAKSVYLHNKAYYMLRRDNPNSSVKNKGKVYCMCDEYDFIRNFLKTKPEIENILAPICAYARFNNYSFTLKRIADEFKLEFCNRFSEDFKKLSDAGEIDDNLYNEQQLKKLKLIISNPEKFYYTKIFKFTNENPTIDEILKQNIALNYKIEDVNAKIDILRREKNNKNFKYYFNKIQNTYQTYGFKYTLMKIIKKFAGQ